MSNQDKPNDGSLVPAGRSDLALVTAANPLVSRGLADLGQRRLRLANEAVANDPNNALFFYERAVKRSEANDYLNAIKDFLEAIRLFGEALRVDPDSPFSYLHRGKTWLELRMIWLSDEDKAEFYEDKADSDEEREINDERQFQLLDRGMKDIDKAILLNPRYSAAYFERGRAWKSYLVSDYDKAIKDFDEAISLDPSNALYYFHRGSTWKWKEDYDRAINDLSDAIRLDPNNADYYLSRGHTWSRKKEYDKEIEDFSQTIRLDPNNAHYYKNRADAWMQKNDCDKALKDYGEAIRLDPGHGFFYYRRAQLWCFKKEFDKAIKDFEETIRQSPDFASVYSSLAWPLATCPEEKVRDGKRAIELATKAIELSKSKGGYYLDHLAAAYAEVGNFDAAVSFAEKALEDPRWKSRNEPFRQRLELYKQKKPFRQNR